MSDFPNCYYLDGYCGPCEPVADASTTFYASGSTSYFNAAPPIVPPVFRDVEVGTNNVALDQVLDSGVAADNIGAGLQIEYIAAYVRSSRLNGASIEIGVDGVGVQNPYHGTLVNGVDIDGGTD
jgi:hypothetical protein